jgi:DNA-binding Lrp family transcriptional regulator
MDLLIADGRRSNRELAAEVGLTDVTVAARLRTLMDRKVFRVGALIDWQAAGYEFGVTMMVEVNSAHLSTVGDRLAELPFVYFVGAVFGSADFVISALVSTFDDVQRLTTDAASIAGVTRVNVDVVYDTVKLQYRYAMLSSAPDSLELPNPRVPLDDLDHKIVSSLIVDGRVANRELARQLDCSEGTIRARIRRLEDSGLLRVLAQVDPFLAREVGALAYVGLSVEGPAMHHVTSALSSMTPVMTLWRSTGRFQLMAAVGAAERPELIGAVMTDIQSLPGVRSTETWEIVRFIKMSSSLVRFIPD